MERKDVNPLGLPLYKNRPIGDDSKVCVCVFLIICFSFFWRCQQKRVDRMGMSGATSNRRQQIFIHLQAKKVKENIMIFVIVIEKPKGRLMRSFF